MQLKRQYIIVITLFWFHQANATFMQSCVYDTLDLAKKSTSAISNYNNSDLLSRQGQFSAFMGAKTVNGVSKKGMYVVESGESNDGTVFIPLEGEGPFLMNVKMPSLTTLNITVANTPKGYAISLHHPGQFSFFRDEAILFYTMNLEPSTQKMLVQDELFEKNYVPKKEILTVTDNETRAAVAEYAIKKLEAIAPQCFDVLSRAQIAQLDQKINELFEIRKKMKVLPKRNPLDLKKNLDATTKLFGGLDEAFIKQAVDAFAIDEALLEMSKLSKTAKAKRYFQFKEEYPEKEMDYYKESTGPLCSEEKMKSTLQKCLQGVEGMALPSDKKSELTTRINMLIGASQEKKSNSATGSKVNSRK